MSRAARPPVVSVCMASYNHAPFIRTAVDSVMSQSFTDWELVITDDGSTDGTIEAIEDIRDERMHIERFPENRTACVALNHSIRRARGAFIAVLNSDDAWQPEKLAKQLAVMTEQPKTAATFTLVEMIDERGRPLPESHHYNGVFEQANRTRHEWLSRLLLIGNCLCHPSVLVRRSVYDEVGLYDEYMAQVPDWDMWVRITLKHDIWIIQEPLTTFRILDGERNASGNRPSAKARCEVELQLMLLKVLRSHPQEIVQVLTAHEAGARDAEHAAPYDALRVMLDAPDTGPRLSGMRAAMILWMYEQLQGRQEWQLCKQFIAATAAREACAVAMPDTAPAPDDRPEQAE
jgi:hypothetical protein